MMMLVRVVGDGDGRLGKGHDDGIVVVAVVTGGPVCVCLAAFFFDYLIRLPVLSLGYAPFSAQQ
jgi:hypothetical protein